MTRFLSPPVGAEKARAYLINLSTNPPAAGFPAVEVGTIWSQPDTGLVQRCSGLNPPTWQPINSGSVLATDTVAGQTRLSVAPQDPNAPRAVGANDPRVSPATTSQDGLQSSADKGKLDSIAANAQPNPSSGEILDGLKTVDGAGSSLDSDAVDGEHAAAFEHAANRGAVSGYAPLDASQKVPVANLPPIPDSPDDIGALPATDAGQPRPPTGPAGGDLSGTYPSPELKEVAIPGYTPGTTITNATLVLDEKRQIVEIISGSVSGVPLASSQDEGVVRTNSDAPAGEVPVVPLMSDLDGVGENITTVSPLARIGDQLSINAATEVTQGSTRYATAAETLAGMATNRSVHPAGLRSVVAPTKLAYLAFGGTGTGSGTLGLSPRTDLANFHVRNVVRLPVATKRFRFKIRNYELRGEVPHPGAVTVTGGFLGKHAPNTNGDWTGNFAAAPSQMFGSGLLPTDGGEWVSGWIDAAALQLEARTDYVVSIGYTAAAGQSITQASNRAYVGSTAANATATTNPITGFSNQPFAMLMEYEFEGHNPVVMAIGDSIVEGSGSRLGQRHNWLTQFGLRTGAVPIVSGIGGSQASEWVNSGGVGYKYSRFDYQNPAFSLDATYIALGRNDLSAGRTPTEMQTNLQAVANFVRNNFKPGALHFATVLPTSSAGWTATQEANRRAVNEWIRTLPAGAASILHFDKALSEATRGAAGLSVAGRGDWSAAASYAVDDLVAYRGLYWRAAAANTNAPPVNNPASWQQVLAMHVDYDSGDGIHPGEAGQARLAGEVPSLRAAGARAA